MNFWIGLAIAIVAPIVMVEYFTPMNTIQMTVPDKEVTPMETNNMDTNSGIYLGNATSNTLIYGNTIYPALGTTRTICPDYRHLVGNPDGSYFCKADNE